MQVVLTVHRPCSGSHRGFPRPSPPLDFFRATKQGPKSFGNLKLDTPNPKIGYGGLPGQSACRPRRAQTIAPQFLETLKLGTEAYLVKVLLHLGELERQLVLDGLVPRLDDDCVSADGIDEAEQVPQLTWSNSGAGI